MVQEGPAVARRVVLLTGATGAIGRAIARQLATHEDHELVLACRREDAARALVDELTRAEQKTRVRYLLADFSQRSSVYALAAAWSGPLSVLINNAAHSPKKRQLSEGALEAQFATNVLGYVWMMEAFAPVLAASAPARVVNVASYYAGDLDLSDLQFERRRYDNNQAYRQSKQANRMLTVAYAERFRERGISVNACHPGDVSSKLSNDLGFGGSMTAEAGARTPVWLATDEAGQRNTGRFFASCRATDCSFARDRQAIEALYAACQAYV